MIKKFINKLLVILFFVGLTTILKPMEYNYANNLYGTPFDSITVVTSSYNNFIPLQNPIVIAAPGNISPQPVKTEINYLTTYQDVNISFLAPEAGTYEFLIEWDTINPTTNILTHHTDKRAVPSVPQGLKINTIPNVITIANTDYNGYTVSNNLFNLVVTGVWRVY